MVVATPRRRPRPAGGDGEPPQPFLFLRQKPRGFTSFIFVVRLPSQSWWRRARQGPPQGLRTRWHPPTRHDVGVCPLAGLARALVLPREGQGANPRTSHFRSSLISLRAPCGPAWGRSVCALSGRILYGTNWGVMFDALRHTTAKCLHFSPARRSHLQWSRLPAPARNPEPVFTRTLAHRWRTYGVGCRPSRTYRWSTSCLSIRASCSRTR